MLNLDHLQGLSHHRRCLDSVALFPGAQEIRITVVRLRTDKLSEKKGRGHFGLCSGTQGHSCVVGGVVMVVFLIENHCVMEIIVTSPALSRIRVSLPSRHTEIAVTAANCKAAAGL